LPPLQEQPHQCLSLYSQPDCLKANKTQQHQPFVQGGKGDRTCLLGNLAELATLDGETITPPNRTRLTPFHYRRQGSPVREPFLQDDQLLRPGV